MKKLLLPATLLLAASAHAGPVIEHWVQPGGAQVYLVQSHRIPMLDVQIDFDAGSRRDAAGQSGLAEATASILALGSGAYGALPARDENQLGEAWADLGASFGCGAGGERTSCHLRTLTDGDLLARSVQQAAQQLAAPAFDAALWQRERERWSQSIRESLTRPGPVAARAFDAAVYTTHPYAASTTPESLARISTDDLRAFWRTHWQPCQARISFVGKATRAQADAIATELLAGLAKNAPADASCPTPPAVPEVPPLHKAQAQHIVMPSAQTHVLIGQPGYTRRDPDFFPLLVGNHILGGGGFTSRLMHQVREQRGLSYSVGSSFEPGLHAGAFTIGLQTRPDQAAAAAQLAQRIVEDFVRTGPTEEELQAAKDNLTGSFPLRLDSNAKLLANTANIAWNGLPLDYLDHWTERVQAVTARDIQRAFARVLQPGRMVRVTVGPADTGEKNTASPAKKAGK